MFSDLNQNKHWIKLMDQVADHGYAVPCTSTDPDVWFPDLTYFDKYASAGTTRIAKELCNTCPIKAQCLEYALKADEQFGIWGGLTTHERHQLRRK